MIWGKKKRKEAIWEKNMKKLKDGKFGELEHPQKCCETLARYWKAQAEAGYPLAVENMKYFEDMARKESEDTE